jgi:glycosyltransferase involved in cell wall biosynthesis
VAHTKLNLLFITQEYSDQSTGGAGVYAYELCKALAESGRVEVHALVPGTRSIRKQIEPGLTVHQRKTIFRPLLQVPLFYWQVWRQAPRIIAKEQIEVIHTNENAGITVLGRRPNVATIHHPIRAEGRFTTLWQRLIILPDIIMEKVIMRRAGHIVVPSHLAQDLLLEFMPALKAKLTLLPNGLDLRKFKPQAGAAAQLRKKFRLGAGTVLVFFPGGLRAKRKGALDVIAALQQLKDLPDYRVVISGKSRELGWQAELRGAMAASGLQQNFIDVGEIDYGDLPQYFAAADVVLYPSWFEGYGLPVIEAMASGKAIITTKTGEAPHIIHSDHDGILVDPQQPAQLAAAISGLLRDPQKRQRLGLAAHKRIGQTFAWEAVVNKLIALYLQAKERP